MNTVATKNIMEASHQWASRPADQRFENIAALKKAVEDRTYRSREEVIELATGAIGAEVINNRLALCQGDNVLEPTHWSFGQLCSRLEVPADYLRKVSPEVAAYNLNYMVNRRAELDKDRAVKLLTIDSPQDGVPDVLQATTGKTYGRIWDIECVEAVEQILNEFPEFYNPKEWSGKPSGLYASDRDCFMFFIDGGSIVDGGGERDQLHRGFYVGNSEVGAMTFFMSTFYFRYVCGNHIIWEAQNVREVRIRHTISAPSRFATEAKPTLKALTEGSVLQFENLIHAAKDYELVGGKDKVIEMLKEKGFTNAEAKRGYETAEIEEGKCANLWDIIQGLTAAARTIAFMDARLQAEKRASDLLKLAA